MKKKILYGVGILTALSLLFLVVMMYLMTDGYRNYKNYCSQYIPKLETYYKKYNSFPPSLDVFEKSVFDFRYSTTDCGYEQDTNTFTLFVSDGYLGYWGYNSSTKEWWYD